MHGMSKREAKTENSAQKAGEDSSCRGAGFSTAQGVDDK